MLEKRAEGHCQPLDLARLVIERQHVEEGIASGADITWTSDENRNKLGILK